MINYLKAWRSIMFAVVCVVGLLSTWYYHKTYLLVAFNADTVGQEIDNKTIVIASSLCNCQRESMLRNGPADEFHWCNSESSSRGGNQKIISYALFGESNTERYFKLIANISLTAADSYPGWIVRIYHNFSRDGPAYGRLCSVYCQHNNVDLCSVPDMINEEINSGQRSRPEPIDADLLRGLEPQMWRFLVALDVNVDVFISRDIDSVILQREVDAVQEWLRSNYTFHTMRDHPQHGVTFLAGMWGAKLAQRRDLIQGLTRAIINAGQRHKVKSPADQTALNDILWPTAQYDVMVHDSYHCQIRSLNAKTGSPNVYPFPSQRVNFAFVGNIKGLSGTANECPEACRPTHHQDWKYC
ncbi:hypothetical protein GHT06_001531 [Daphnia sinensis]|uniref:Uncharacterized protein n=1 Tax=Daphnia sinensis TaxID=1820382 RepID=A0AAD5PMM4_9CRUS|nr:hypothetical protein GHT06_001531 [Daphnia sinensis]